MENSNIYNGGGGESHNNLLKSHYKKSLFALIKATKRYYLGIWLIKLPFYAIFSESKAKKYREKRNARLENLRIAKKRFKTIRTLSPQIKDWIESSEFKEKYTNHPYPPLLNPQNIDYESITAEVAWELNLPLPPYYELIFLSNGASGVAATLSFLNECGVKLAGMSYTPKDSFVQLYDFLVKNVRDSWHWQDSQNRKDSQSDSHKIALSFFAECIVPYPEFYDDFKSRPSKFHDDATKLVNCIRKKVPLLYVARDPIGRMRTIINHINNLPVTPIMTRFNLNVPYEELFVKSTYFGKVEKPSFAGLDDYGEVAFLYTRLLSDSLFDAFSGKVSEIHCIEFNDLMPEVAFDTFIKLSRKFGFSAPKHKDAFLSRRSFCNGGAITTLPITLYAHSDDLNRNAKNMENTDLPNLDSLNKKGGFSVTIAVFTGEVPRDFVDISDEIEPNIIIDEAKIAMLVNKKELDLLKQNKALYDATKSYLKGYVASAKANVATIRGNLIKDSDIIEYLHTHSDKRAFYKGIFDNELNYIKAHYPHFLKKWSAYNAFEKICNELDL